MRSFKALGLLLTYPRAELVRALPELEAVLRDERALSPDAFGRLGPLLSRLSSAPLLDLQERYVALFDRTPSLSLHLYEHVHGDARERGQAMVDLAAVLARHGYAVAGKELPDYLPLLCELFSLISELEARAVLADACAVIALVQARLSQKDSDYAPVLGALCELSQQPVDADEVARVLEQDARDEQSLAAIDREWEEQAVRFGVGAAHDSCQAPAEQPLVTLRTPARAAEERP